MSSLAFNRKYRSQCFADLVGQGHIATTLRNAVKNNRVAHAYLFCGPRGVGKTSAARILAKAVNCPNARDGEPCGACETCLAIQEGRAIDVFEADAASNRGIEDIRGIRERVGLSPAAARYKFYILDEAHMLTTEASNALLKTLEEPPAHAIFVLVTTDPQKLPETIVSRCQRLDFRRITVADAADRLAFVCDQEEITPEPGLLEMLARAAAGSLRDAEGSLDQLVAFAGKRPGLADARAILGAAGPDAARRLIALLVARDTTAALRLVNDLVAQGADARQIALDVVSCLRDLMLLRTSERLTDLVDASPETLPEFIKLAEGLSPPRIVELIRIFQPGPPARGGFRPQLPLEMAIVEAEGRFGSVASDARSAAVAPGLTRRPEPREPIGARRQDEPVRIADSGPPPEPVAVSAIPDAVARTDADAPRTAASTDIAPAPPPPPAAPQPGILVHEARRRWNDILDLCGVKSRSLQAVLRSGQPVGSEDGTLVLGFPYPFHRERVEDQRNRSVVEEVVGQVLGQKIQIRCTQSSREAIAAADPFQAAMEDPVVKAAIEMGARVRSVTVEGSEEKT